MSRRTKWIVFGGVAAVGVAVVVAGLATLRSDWFREQVRRRIIAEVEKATGGRAELGGFDFDWRALKARTGRFVLHGRERPGEPVFLEIANVEVGLKLVSALRRDVDIDSLIIESPRVHVIVYPDGGTNIPEPPAKQRRSTVAEDLLKLAVRRFQLNGGLAEIRDERIPFSLRGEDLRAAFEYLPDGPRYRGHVASRRLHVDAKPVRPAAFDFDADLMLTARELQIEKASLVDGRCRLAVTGAVRQWDNPRADLQFESTVAIADLGRLVDLPIARTGEASAHGAAWVTWGHGFDFGAEGRFEAKGLAYRDARVNLSVPGARGGFQLRRDSLTLPDLVVNGQGGAFEGRVELAKGFERLRVEGVAKGLALPDLPWNGTASGPVRIDGYRRDLTIQATLNIAPAPGPNPIEGNVDLIYDRASGKLRLGDSSLTTRSTRVRATGTLGETLRISLESSDLNDLTPALERFSPETKIPIRLAGGAAHAEFAVSGGVQTEKEFRPEKISGTLSLGRFEYEGHVIDSLRARIEGISSQLTAQDIEITQKTAVLTGSARVALDNWKTSDGSPLQASLRLKGGDLESLLAEAKQKLPVTGRLTASAEITGTIGGPVAALQITVDGARAWQERIEQLSLQASVANTAIEIRQADLRTAQGRVQFKATYRRTGVEWDSGTLRFDVSGSGLRIEEIAHVREREGALAGMLSLKGSGAARLRKSEVELETLDSQLSLTGLVRGKARIGVINAAAQTRSGLLAFTVEGNVRGSQVHGVGEWKLEGDYPGRGEVYVTALPFATLHDIAQGGAERELPFVGVVDGHAVVSGPLKKLDALTADISLPRVQINANPNQTLRAGARLQDLALRNTEPVRFTATRQAVQIQSARFAATDTSLDATGRVAFDAKSPWDVTLRGRMNLAILQLFNSDIAARGAAVLNTAIRGPLDDPQLSGKLELNNASLYLADLPPSLGVDNANGVIVFDRNRANIERLNAEVGGGKVNFSGFIGFAGGVLLYRVQGAADQVRLRHPDGISVTLNAAVNLTGTSENGLISGTVTVVRAAFETHTDLGSLLAQSAKPLPAPSAPSEYLRGLNFDVRIESGPNLEVQTSLTRDVEAEAELRLRGNAARPMLLGDISINQGEIQFLGNKYTVNRAEIRFINPTKVEPTFDVDLETKARGITVNISFSGTMTKLNATYRSDPPLQSSDIIALLAVGRDPNSTALSNAQSRTNLLETGASTLSQAVAAPVSNRLQRFFGVSRLKIDPSLTGVENIPQARVTLEQQVSRDITLTYITNLSRTQEQIVRVQWDINRRWSAIAVREENGVFGIDFQYRKRF
ncbi:MAG: translocation/assembly module TamB domain-containing protein [Acidobacteria bacterium]|nr:translocation/assembly module TamB domain-containing protein [Acidobacteriota bacterium]